MKTPSTLLIGGSSLLAVLLLWTSGARAGIRGSSDPLAALDNPLGDLLHRHCVVTIDPLALPAPVIAGQANVVTGFSAPNTIEGMVTRIDADWLVLHDNGTENWVPRPKVLLIHISK